MKTSIACRTIVVGIALALWAAGAAAQSDASASADGSTYYTPNQRGFWSYGGGAIGGSDYGLTCQPGYGCDTRDLGLKLYAGGKFSEFTGLEGSYVYLGDAHAGGGRTWGQGLNLSLVGTLPLSQSVGLNARVGSIFGWTRVGGSAPGMATGNDHGFGLSYGTGLTYALSRTLGLRLDWDRYRLPFATGRHDVDLTTVGLQFNY